jgi:hypothetical protein
MPTIMKDGRCAFCGGSDVDDEHVLGRQLRKLLLPLPPGMTHFEHTRAHVSGVRKSLGKRR